MRSPRPRRDPERGNSLLLALIVMSALATLGSLTVVSMQSSIQMSTNDRAQTIALYAAESGAAVAMDYLRKHFDASGNAPFSGATSWSAYCTANNQLPLIDMSALIPSSDALPGTPNNLLDLADPTKRDQNAWFHIDVLNNRDDPGYGTNTSTCDTDGILLIRSTGHGPQGSLAIIEWEVQRVGFWGSVQPTTAVVPPLPPTPATRPPVAPSFWLFPPELAPHTVPEMFPPYPPSVPWAGWTPLAPTTTSTTGMVLRSWHIVSL